MTCCVILQLRYVNLMRKHRRMSFSTTLRWEAPAVSESPSSEALSKIHDLAHRNCFVANSIRFEVRIEPVV